MANPDPGIAPGYLPAEYVRGETAARNALAAIRVGLNSGDELHRAICDVAASTVALRGFCREIQKHIEGNSHGH